ncbi:protein of unknown function [Paenibacillus alvei]|uniref:Uncharacterized protein n=1 Tax=Paenibacillus alvei TaxID=44250 RepID=A0A383R593_PAEAL|nr:protein of unknown function [Paenibacillus alvei]
MNSNKLATLNYGSNNFGGSTIKKVTPLIGVHIIMLRLTLSISQSENK